MLYDAGQLSWKATQVPIIRSGFAPGLCDLLTGDRDPTSCLGVLSILVNLVAGSVGSESRVSDLLPGSGL